MEISLTQSLKLNILGTKFSFLEALTCFLFLFSTFEVYHNRVLFVKLFVFILQIPLTNADSCTLLESFPNFLQQQGSRWSQHPTQQRHETKGQDAWREQSNPLPHHRSRLGSGD